MKIALVLITVTFLAVINVCLADSDPHAIIGHHHVTKHVTQHNEGSHGDANKGAKHSAHKHVKKSGRQLEFEEERGKKGSKDVEKHVVTTSEEGGAKSKSHLEDNHKSHKKSGARSEHGASFRAGGKQKKSNFSKGFRELYHKDEHKNHDSFYKNEHKSGAFRVYGAKNQKHQSHHFNKDQHGKYISKKFNDKHERKAKDLHGKKSYTHKTFHHDDPHNKHYINHSKKGGKKHPVPLHH